MLYTSDPEVRNKAYNELVGKLIAGESRGSLYEDIKELCENCRPLNPVICKELCQMWELKRELHDVSNNATGTKFSLTDLLKLMRNSRRQKILEVLTKKPCTLMELRSELVQSSYHHSANLLRDQYVEPLLAAGLVTKEKEQYKISYIGEGMHNIFSQSGIAQLSIHLNEYEEKILISLLSGSRSYDELTKIVPRRSLHRSLRRLLRNDLIIKSNVSGRVFYFRAKRRPTRKLSPTGIKIFKALPKEGISVQNLSEKTGISVRGIYTHLRRLRYKRHVKKEKKTNLYRLTDTSKYLANSLNVAHDFLQSQSA